MSSSQDKIFLEFDEGDEAIFSRVKTLSELKSRTHDMDELIITDSDKEVANLFFSDGVDDMRNQLGIFGDMKNLEGTVIFTLSESQTEQGLKEARGLFVKAIAQYVLARWFEELGQAEIANREYSRYEKYIRDIRTNTTQPASISPKYRPYF